MAARRWSAHLSTLYGERPFLERAACAFEDGFGAVETWWPGDELPEWTAAIRRAGLGVACINADGGNLTAGERGFLNVPGRRDWVLASIAAAIAAARSVGAATVNVLPGRVLPDVPERQQWISATRTLCEAAKLAAQKGVVLVVEHLNVVDVPGAFLSSPAEVTRLLDMVGSDSVRLLYDVYHAAMAGEDPLRQAPRLAERIGHVQYASTPGRHEPGDGGSALRAIDDALGEAGYTGYIGLEITPLRDTGAALAALGWPATCLADRRDRASTGRDNA